MQAPRYAGIRDYLAVLRRNILLIVATTVVAGAIAFVVAGNPAVRYKATATVTYEDETRNLAYLGLGSSDVTPVDNSPAVQAQKIKSPPVVTEVRRTLGAQLPDATLLGAIDVKVNSTAPVAQITATDADPARATRLANAFATAAQKVTNADSRDRLIRLAARIKGRLDALGETQSAQALRPQLAQQLATVDYLTTSARPARLVTAAQGSTKIGADRGRKVGLGLLLGLGVGLIGAFLRDALDQRLHGPTSIADELDMPTLGQIRSKALGRVLWPADARDKQLAADVESVQIIRQNVEHLGETAPRSILVTSTSPSEGKSTVAASLAAAAAETSRRTVLVECDLRKPSLSDRLRLNEAPGLSDFLLEKATLEDVIQTAAPAHGAEQNGNRSGAPFDCITAGSPTHQPTALLASERSRSLLAELRSRYELVILDTSPLLPVADTLELLELVDGILLCVRSGQTTRQQTLAGKKVIALYEPRPTGVVITGLRPRDEPGYGGYGGYGGYAGYS